jgi:hypothetical protein
LSRHDKLVDRLKTRPRDFTYQELKRMLAGLGYEEDNRGKSSGSRVAFVNYRTGHLIRLHKPHPGNELKLYQIDFVLESLTKKGLI